MNGVKAWYDTSVGRTVRWDPCMSHEDRRAKLLQVAKLYSVKEFVETGTNDGATTIFMHNNHDFERLYTIEVGEHIFKRNQPMFKKYSKILPILGDSAAVLPELVRTKLNGPALFWLDGHFCGDARADKDTPVKEEIETILSTGVPHVVLIDDARLFGNDPEYPSLDWVRNYATTRDIEYRFVYDNDIIFLLPNPELL